MDEVLSFAREYNRILNNNNIERRWIVYRWHASY